MPDDRDSADTRASARLMCRPDPRPGRRGRVGGVVQPERVPSTPDDILLKKPLGILFWLALGWVGLVVILAIIANLLPLPNPDFQNYAAINALTEHPPPVGHRRPRT